MEDLRSVNALDFTSIIHVKFIKNGVFTSLLAASVGFVFSLIELAFISTIFHYIILTTIYLALLVVLIGIIQFVIGCYRFATDFQEENRIALKSSASFLFIACISFVIDVVLTFPILANSTIFYFSTNPYVIFSVKLVLILITFVSLFFALNQLMKFQRVSRKFLSINKSINLRSLIGIIVLFVVNIAIAILRIFNNSYYLLEYSLTAANFLLLTWILFEIYLLFSTMEPAIQREDFVANA